MIFFLRNSFVRRINKKATYSVLYSVQRKDFLFKFTSSLYTFVSFHFQCGPKNASFKSNKRHAERLKKKLFSKRYKRYSSLSLVLFLCSCFLGIFKCQNVNYFSTFCIFCTEIPFVYCCCKIFFFKCILKFT